MSVELATVVTGQELTKRYGEGDAAVDALRGVSVQFESGTFSAIMGPSGSGKSTLMHILAGLESATTGSVLIENENLGEMNDSTLTKLRREKIGFIFQNFNLLPVLTAEENVTLPLSIAGDKIDATEVTVMLQAVGIADRRTHRPSELSGGQQQRVAVARALFSKPTVVFADEPTGNLDSEASADVLALLRKAVDEYGQTIVMVTHDPAAAAAADRVLFLADGQITRDEGGMSTDQILDAMKRLHG